MSLTRPYSLPLWTVAGPIVACALLAAVWGRPLGGLVAFGVAVAMIACVMVAVQHAETVAHRVGEPFGALILALAVTVIEVSLIVSLKLFGGDGQDTLARDTVFATVMIVCNGIVGLCLLAGALRNHVAVFRVEGSSPALAVLIPLTTLALVLPQFTTTTVGPTYSNLQLAFAGLMSLLLFGVYVFVQTIRHREHFLPVHSPGDADDDHGEPPAKRTAVAAFVLLCVALVAVVGLAKTLAPGIEAVVKAIGAPSSFVGVIIALIVLLPETGAAFRAAVRNRMQISLNLALGSALATIGLTIPAIGVVAIVLDMPMTLGLPPKEIVLLVLTFAVSIITLASGRATVLHGTVHLVVFAAFLFLSIVP
jgi:Ca2+:H+ antiporter